MKGAIKVSYKKNNNIRLYFSVHEGLVISLYEIFDMNHTGYNTKICCNLGNKFHKNHIKCFLVILIIIII